MILLITKYNLSSRWLHLFTFLIFYLICIKLHYIELNNNNFVECMMKSSINSSSSLSHLRAKLPSADSFPENLRQHALILSPEELSIRINDNIRQINEKVSIIEETQCELINKEQQVTIPGRTMREGRSTLVVESPSGKIIRNLPASEIKLRQEMLNLNNTLQSSQRGLHQHLNDLHNIRPEHTARVVEEMQSRFDMLEADCKSVLSSKIEVPEAIDTSNFVTIDQLHKSHQELYTNIENNFKKGLSTVSTLQTELTNEINTRKVLETRVTNLEEELREIRRALMFRGTIMDPFVQQQITLNEVKQTTQETNTAVIPR